MKLFVCEAPKGEPEIFSDVDAWAEEQKRNPMPGLGNFGVDVVQSIFHNGCDRLNVNDVRMYVIDLPPFIGSPVV